METISITSYSDDESKLKEDEMKDMERKGNIPMILICVNGGPDCLIYIKEALKHKIPVLILEV